MDKVSTTEGGKRMLLQANEAIARGALEAGIIFAAGYPGNPSSEIIETLAKASHDLPIYVEWSVNEKVALEAAAGASFAGCRAICSMKQNGVNVVSDFLTNLSLSGTKGGIVLVSCDDPGGISSTNEEDARAFAPLSDIPLLEPSSPQEALDMTRWAFDLSEAIGNIVMIRSVSRLSHSRSDVVVGGLPDFTARPYFDTQVPFHTFPIITKHQARHEKLKAAEDLFEKSSFNYYRGAQRPELLVIGSGCAVDYALDAIQTMNLWERVGVLKLGTTWPIPRRLLLKHLQKCQHILFVEDVDPFIETHVKAFAAERAQELGLKVFHGKGSDELPSCGELRPAQLLDFFGNYFNLSWGAENFTNKVETLINGRIPPREFGFCPGCPHRGSFYAIKTALAWDDRDGFVSGDIGCYSMAIWPTGFNQLKSVHAMGSGLGIACGYGKLENFGFEQPVITVCGDSTFYHAALPALVNARFNNADILLVVLDNSATAMTGFQPHPGTGKTAMGEPTQPVDVVAICKSMGLDVYVGDPYEMKQTAEKLYELMQQRGPRVMVLRRKCALVQGREGGFPYGMHVDQDLCIGEECGCGRYCTRIFRCPGLIWDKEKKKAVIDQVICVGCGICAEICPQGAIKKELK
ncbi:MAG: indolepyruvate ferredoxin oxidoreductase [Deltaproteobacteria bacterium]|nr:MAG: indolepyruvate ferredoxin oxidoreductase [Deltaproteobacteria bacterium]